MRTTFQMMMTVTHHPSCSTHHSHLSLCLCSCTLVCSLPYCSTVTGCICTHTHTHTHTHRHPPPTRCRQCPGYSEPFIGSAHPSPPTYTCPLGGNHILCTCCVQPMPDRRSEVACPRPQKCEGLYIGQDKGRCEGVKVWTRGDVRV